MVTIDPTFGILLEDRDVWARQIVSSKEKKRKPAPSRVDLEAAITGIQIEDTINGSSTVTLSLIDPGFDLSGGTFFDPDKDGRFDGIEVNYPDGSEYWWSLTQVEISDEGGAPTLSLSFMERLAADLLEIRGPFKIARSKRTRAEFFKMSIDKVKVHGGATFHSKDLHQVQPIAGGVLKQEKGRKKAKDSGINGDESIKVKGWDGGSHSMTAGELRNAEIALDEAFTHTQDERAILALSCACIVEAPFFANPIDGDNGKSSGILQLTNEKMGGSTSTSGGRRDIPLVVGIFMSKGYTGAGGAAELARKHPDWSPGKIAQTCQGSAYGDRYDQVRDGAEKILEAYGGSGGISTTHRKTYFLQIGTPEKPREDFWEGLNRLAEEVVWPFFIDGPNAYFDPETTLIRQKPAAVVKRGAPQVKSFRINCDVRQIATEATLVLFCDPLEFRAGETFKLEGFGPGSRASTVKLPGRWLIEEVSRNRYDLFSTFILKQPEAPDPEPAPEIATKTFSGEDVAEGAADIYDASEKVSRQKRPYVYGGGHGPISSIGEHSGLDCSSAVSLALSMAGMFNGSVTMTSGTLASSWGESGQGETFTVWANGGHAFLQSEGPGKKWRLDTSSRSTDSDRSSGPRLRDSHRETGGFTPKHWKGR